MSQKQQNKFLVGYGAVTGVLALALGYLCYSANTSLDEASQKLETKRAQIKNIRNAPIYPKPEHVTKKRAEVDAYIVEVDKTHAAAREFQPDLDLGITPDDLKTKLGNYKTQLIGIAQGRKIGLPQDFGLGLSRYLTDSPTRSATPEVNYLVEAVNVLATSLLENQVDKIDVLECPKMPYEEAGSAGSAPAGKPGAPGAAKPGTSGASTAKKPLMPSQGMEESAVFRRYPIQLAFAGSEDSVRECLNKITSFGKGGPFFVINNLRLENEKKEGPARDTTPFQPTQLPEKEGETKRATPVMVDARFILGNERVSAFLDMDLLYFNPPAPAPAKGGAPAPAPAPAPARPSAPAPATQR